MINCIIIEDDRLALEVLSNLINQNFSKKVKILGIAGTAREGIELIRQKSPDLIFLDIELPDANGFLIFNSFPNPIFEVIFTTSSPEYAIAAIKHMAIDYLLKPINLMDLSASFVRLEKKRNEPKLTNNTIKKLVENFKMGISFDEKIALSTLDGFQILAFNEILYCQASENYSYIHTISNETILVTKTLKCLEEQLPSASFFRIHKSVLLNINYVKCFSRRNGLMVTLETGHQFEIATRRYEEFINHLLKKNPALEQKTL